MKIDELAESDLPSGWSKENTLGNTTEVFTNGTERVSVSLETGHFNGSVYILESTTMDGVQASTDWDYIMDQAVELMLSISQKTV